ncbi:MAG: exodeoxyribonuclease VII large subunit [Anaerolineae bacterium]|nr:exodeoxyribonuclease VII large subunit [Anaerolineae bacterium]
MDQLPLLFNTPVTYTVTEFSRMIQSVLNDDRLIGATVEGEVSEFKQASSGHYYFTLKDSGAAVRCAMWRSNVQRNGGFTPRVGDHVQARGTIELYAPRGDISFIIDRLKPLGVGDLFRQFELLKAQLIEEGLFDQENKRDLPIFPTRIGVVTSPEAAAFQDVLKVLRRRFPLAAVILSPTLVQGDSAPPAIVRALAALNARDDIQVILICRGGGSIEDLWAFNDERVVRAVAASRIPTITGVGHETDSTLVDFAADMRAATPSNAAEILTPDIETLQISLAQTRRNLQGIASGIVASNRQLLDDSIRSLRRSSPTAVIAEQRQRVDGWGERLENRQEAWLALLHEQLHSAAAVLNAHDPMAPLHKGYALVRHRDTGKMIKTIAGAATGDALTIQLQDGELNARVE